MCFSVLLPIKTSTSPLPKTFSKLHEKATEAKAFAQACLAFKLYGLDATNDKSFERFVVLHVHACVPESEVTAEICQSDGCPTVAPGFLKQLEPVIKQSEKPVLLWIVESLQ